MTRIRRMILTSLVIVVALVAFKDEVVGFIEKVKNWISGSDVPS